MLPSIFDIIVPMHQQSLILLHPTVREKMHLQENTLFDIDLWVKVSRNVSQYPLHHVNYQTTKYEAATSIGSGGETFKRNALFDL